ncbi:MAG TPA: hypothetical protein VF668_00880 [Pyrinomonadaceae bacterium]|jgi:hypothetical protein
MERPPELLKDVADRLARAVVTEDGAQVTRLLRLAGLLGDPSSPAPERSLTDNIGGREGAGEAPAESPSPPRIGIWEGEQVNGRTCFVRRQDMMGEWSFWANVGRIEPKGDRLRILLLGESVARGYLYDPLFNMAGALEEVLQSQLGEDNVEVIDLARTNLGLDLTELARSALLLEPDAAIIFAGNNWSVRYYGPHPYERAALDAQIRRQGVPGLKRGFEERLAEQARSGVKEIASLYQAEGTPLVWMVPEFNLGDWRDPVAIAPHLSRGGNREWLALWDGARDALRDGDFETAADLAKQMVQLDGGTTATGLYILAECSQQLGDPVAGRRYLELARDATIWDCSRAISPRPYTVTQEVLREEAVRSRNEVVDVPEVFKEYLDGGIPDRRLFLDYCHLTSEGIRVAAAAAASRVLRLLEGVDIHWRELVDRSVAPPPEVEAEASFLAAVHNAHWAQPFDVVRHYCLRAVELSPSVAQIMVRFLDLQTRSAPLMMCRSAEEIAMWGSELMQHYLLHHNRQQLDKTLLDAVVGALEGAGINAGGQLAQLRREEHSVASRDVNLLDYYYVSSARQAQEETWLIPQLQKLNEAKNYYTAYLRESRFFFVGDANRPVRLRLTCRLPESESDEGAISIEVNGGRVGDAVIGRQWSAWEIEVAGGEVRDGLNEVVIRWPTPAFPGDKLFESLIERVTDKSLPEFFCPFGEIYAFSASDAGDGSDVMKQPSPAGH